MIHNMCKSIIKFFRRDVFDKKLAKEPWRQAGLSTAD